ncbi:MAG TPA: ribosomal protein S18-alanine N-acetyltransferase [Candidatus Methylomirabilis sp.]|nr:ribosomal protein S18-alanine N-acetyltransferase [Candidatus Methylomirabilis sp.]
MSASVPEEWSLTPMTLDDLDEVLAIERVSFNTPWSRGAFRYELTQNRVARSMVVRVGGDLAGYLCLWEIGHEIHITNVAVHPSFRRRGIARALMANLLEEARRSAVELVFLEVRPTNVEALALYESFGFRVIGRRKGYYFDTGEDALVMEARLDAAAVGSSGGNHSPV